MDDMASTLRDVPNIVQQEMLSRLPTATATAIAPDLSLEPMTWHKTASHSRPDAPYEYEYEYCVVTWTDY
jgi:hypothetical protein